MTDSNFDSRLDRLLKTRSEPARALLLVRVAVGSVFLVSGIVKFLYENQGAGRFAKLGFPAGVASFVGAVEIVAGAMVVVGLLTRIAAMSLVVDMLVAIVTTKLPIWLGTPPEPIAALPKIGFWAFAYQARLDVMLLLLGTVIVLAGAGAWSLDGVRARRRSRNSVPNGELSAT